MTGFPPPPWTQWNMERPKQYRLLMNDEMVDEFTTRYEGFVAMAELVRSLAPAQTADTVFKLVSMQGDFIGACIVPKVTTWCSLQEMAI
ncbi:MAG: hypothetical protein K6T83_04990 [Alicyclobacillus sp.]|uniref:hypothetical protein n=1 Tax=Alicyclobacillus fructus TaxID=2816082 RepID=UPI001A90279E|nr:hypothetical protein [Alicyclobacillus fructus]MCL6442805.1 hypothetical protein [Alicyclobacillus sp.]